MAKVLRAFEQKTQIEERQNSIKDYLDVHFGMESEDLQKRVGLIGDLEELHRLLRSLYRVDDRQTMEDLIESAILKQEKSQ